jgi:LPXTG-motif cell wall-anchored protein
MTTGRRILAACGVLLLCLGVCSGAGASVFPHLTTLYAADANANGIMFNLDVLSAEDLMIESFDINLTDENNPASISVYIREGGYSGYEHTPDAWTLAGSAVVTAMGKNNITHLPVGGIRLTAGKTYGIYMFATDSDMVPRFRYTLAETEPAYADANLRLWGGAGQYAPPFEGSLYTPRIWNGTVYYTFVPIPQTGDRTGSIWIVWAAVAMGSLLTVWLLRRKYAR